MKTQRVEVTRDQTIFVTEDTQYVLLVQDFFSKAPLTIEFVFEKSAIKAEIILVYCVPKTGELSVTTIANHKVPNTTCLTKVRGVLTDGAVSNYVGKIIIAKKAQQTTSFLNDKVLVVGERTKNNSQPILVIDADDVGASHSASTGRIDADEVYYLQSRGLSKKEAEKVVIEGFFDQQLNEIKDEKVRITLKTLIEKSLSEVQF